MKQYRLKEEINGVQPGTVLELTPELERIMCARTRDDLYERVYKGRFKPGIGDQYYRIGIAANGQILSVADVWCNLLGDEPSYQVGNCFPTRAAAERAIELVKAALMAAHKEDR